MPEFKITREEALIPQPEPIGEGERELLKEMAQPGMPLWKIFRSMLDYREGLKESLVTADDDEPDQRAAVRKVKATIQAIDWTMQQFEAAISPQNEGAKS